MNFLDAYLTYSSSNEAPQIYHKWAGISALSHLIGPRVWTHMGGNLVFYPNMYIILTGNPGVMKSTALKQAEKLINLIPDIQAAPISASKEAITQLMGKKDSPCLRSYRNEKDEVVRYSQLSIFSEEIVSLLNAAGNPNITLEFLTDIWGRVDNVYKETFKNAASSHIEHPYITMLACLTPETLKSLISSKVISGGMSRRCLFIYAYSNEEPHPFIEVNDIQRAALDMCGEHAKMLQTISGPFTWTDEAKHIYINWYTPFKKRISTVESPVLQRFYQSKAEYVIKTSMMLGVSENPVRLVHTAESFNTALEYVTDIERGACMLFDASGRNELGDLTAELEIWLRERHPKTHVEGALISAFYKHLQRPQEEMRIMLDQLERQKRIKITLGSGVPALRYITYIPADHDTTEHKD